MGRSSPGWAPRSDGGEAGGEETPLLSLQAGDDEQTTPAHLRRAGFISAAGVLLLWTVNAALATSPSARASQSPPPAPPAPAAPAPPSPTPAPPPPTPRPTPEPPKPPPPTSGPTASAAAADRLRYPILIGVVMVMCGCLVLADAFRSYFSGQACGYFRPVRGKVSGCLAHIGILCGFMEFSAFFLKDFLAQVSRKYFGSGNDAALADIIQDCCVSLFYGAVAIIGISVVFVHKGRTASMEWYQSEDRLLSDYRRIDKKSDPGEEDCCTADVCALSNVLDTVDGLHRKCRELQTRILNGETGDKDGDYLFRLVRTHTVLSLLHLYEHPSYHDEGPVEVGKLDSHFGPLCINYNGPHFSCRGIHYRSVLHCYLTLGSKKAREYQSPQRPGDRSPGACSMGSLENLCAAEKRQFQQREYEELWEDQADSSTYSYEDRVKHLYESYRARFMQDDSCQALLLSTGSRRIKVAFDEEQNPFYIRGADRQEDTRLSLCKEKAGDLCGRILECVRTEVRSRLELEQMRHPGPHFGFAEYLSHRLGMAMSNNFAMSALEWLIFGAAAVLYTAGCFAIPQLQPDLLLAAGLIMLRCVLWVRSRLHNLQERIVLQPSDSTCGLGKHCLRLHGRKLEDSDLSIGCRARIPNAARRIDIDVQVVGHIPPSDRKNADGEHGKKGQDENALHTCGFVVAVDAEGHRYMVPLVKDAHLYSAHHGPISPHAHQKPTEPKRSRPDPLTGPQDSYLPLGSSARTMSLFRVLTLMLGAYASLLTVYIPGLSSGVYSAWPGAPNETINTVVSVVLVAVLVATVVALAGAFVMFATATSIGDMRDVHTVAQVQRTMRLAAALDAVRVVVSLKASTAGRWHAVTEHGDDSSDDEQEADALQPTQRYRRRGDAAADFTKRLVFCQLDLDDNGQIDLSEVYLLFQRLGVAFEPLKDSEVRLSEAHWKALKAEWEERVNKGEKVPDQSPGPPRLYRVLAAPDKVKKTCRIEPLAGADDMISLDEVRKHMDPRGQTLPLAGRLQAIAEYNKEFEKMSREGRPIRDFNNLSLREQYRYLLGKGRQLEVHWSELEMRITLGKDEWKQVLLSDNYGVRRHSRLRKQAPRIWVPCMPQHHSSQPDVLAWKTPVAIDDRKEGKEGQGGKEKPDWVSNMYGRESNDRDDRWVLEKYQHAQVVAFDEAGDGFRLRNADGKESEDFKYVTHFQTFDGIPCKPNGPTDAAEQTQAQASSQVGFRNFSEWVGGSARRNMADQRRIATEMFKTVGGCGKCPDHIYYDDLARVLRVFRIGRMITPDDIFLVFKMLEPDRRRRKLDGALALTRDDFLLLLVELAVV